LIEILQTLRLAKKRQGVRKKGKKAVIFQHRGTEIQRRKKGMIFNTERQRYREERGMIFNTEKQRYREEKRGNCMDHYMTII
jgi:hypothetical protein